MNRQKPAITDGLSFYCLTIALLIFSGCPNDSSNVAPPNSEVVNREAKASQWGSIHSVETLTPFIGSWHGETHETDELNLELSGAQLREKLKRESKLLLNEETVNPPGITIRLEIKQMSEPIGEVAPFSASIEVDRHAGDHRDDRLEMRVANENTIELRKESLRNTGYQVTLENDGAILKIKSLSREFDSCKLKKSETDSTPVLNLP
ncbi:hypothetical protein [Thalassoglobus neptunius]|nr:hypothetical protein [Thalassoglobus neptunius]